MTYPGIRIEGSILSPDFLGQMEYKPGQKPADFGLPASTKVKDEIARAWADAQDYWRIFKRKLDGLRTESPATSETRQQWVVPLLSVLGYQTEFQARSEELNGKLYAISHRAVNRSQTPIQIVGYREPAGLDKRPENATVRMSAHAVVQEYINLTEQLYGIVTNGRVLRLLRDSSRLVKLSYLEFDLDRIFTDGLYADFAILYRLLHATRLPSSNETAKESWIERYHQDSLDSGARIREGLSKAVEKAIRDFGNGFLAHPANGALREAVADGTVRPEKYYQNLLRLIYRLLFLMVIEERDLVFPTDVPAKQREIYRRYYSVQRLRLLAEHRYLADARHHDLWIGLLSTFRLFDGLGPDGGTGAKLGLAPLGGDLFGPLALDRISGCMLGNDVLLGCLRALSLYEHPGTGLIRVNYAALNVEEFGSVYEGLLEYRAVFTTVQGQVDFGFAKGGERAATGSHYTPDDLVQPLIRHSLDYLIADCLGAGKVEAGKEGSATSGRVTVSATRSQDAILPHNRGGSQSLAEKALLGLRVADIACGSGHILLAAARRIATELASVRTGEDQPSPPAFRAALRDVIRNCIYGVDLNPLAVELCKVALWLEAHNPGQPLNFLDHHIKCGNAIVGFVRQEELDKGIPNEAFATMPGDDKELAAKWRNDNKRDRADTRQLRLSAPMQKRLDGRLEEWTALSALPERTPEEIERKKERFLAFSASVDTDRLETIAALPIAQFYIPKTPENDPYLMTDAQFRRYWVDGLLPHGSQTAMALATAREKRFFHWFLEFPDIVAPGGFDCVLGNPPYFGGSLSGEYGHSFCGYVKWQYAPAGLNDIVAYFLQRISSLLKPNAFTALITTNSIKDGGVQRDGLDQVISRGGEINMVVRGVRWPGRAKLVVCLIAIHSGPWGGRKELDGHGVPTINAFFEPEAASAQVYSLRECTEFVFQGIDFLGDGFLLTHDEAARIEAEEPQCIEVIYPALNGQEVNNAPNLAPGRSIINFRDWSLERASYYRTAIDRVEKLVKAERERQRDPDATARWWQFYRPRIEMWAQLAKYNYCFVCSVTTKYLSFSRVPTNFVFLKTLKVFTTDRWDLFAVVQSTVHEVWARKYSGALETRLRYSPSDCFDTFAFPEGMWQTANPDLAALGERYHEHRKRLMLSLWLGLTDIYNLFHARDLGAAKVAKVSKKPMEEAVRGYAGLLELRRLHVELDRAVRDAYGWRDLELGHDFHEVETLAEHDRVRFTVSAAARKELLRRLLEENHRRAAAERVAAAGKAKKPRRAGTKGGENGELFEVAAD